MSDDLSIGIGTLIPNAIKTVMNNQDLDYKVNALNPAATFNNCSNCTINITYNK